MLGILFAPTKDNRSGFLKIYCNSLKIAHYLLLSKVVFKGACREILEISHWAMGMFGDKNIFCICFLKNGTPYKLTFIQIKVDFIELLCRSII